MTKAARGQDVAKAMLTRLLGYARTYPGPGQVTLSVAVTQVATRNLYDALGFRVYGYEQHSLKVGDTYVDEEGRVLWLAGNEKIAEAKRAGPRPTTDWRCDTQARGSSKRVYPATRTRSHPGIVTSGPIGVPCECGA